MAIEVHVPEVLRRYSGGAEVVRVEAPAVNVRAALEGLFARHPCLRTRTLSDRGALWPYLVLVRNGRELPRDSALDTPVADGDVVEIVGAAEGG